MARGRDTRCDVLAVLPLCTLSLCTSTPSSSSPFLSRCLQVPETGPRKWRAIVCSSNGTRMVAVERRGNVWVSVDRGKTWQASRTGMAASSWESVACSHDGQSILKHEYLRLELAAHSYSPFFAIQSFLLFSYSSFFFFIWTAVYLHVFLVSFEATSSLSICLSSSDPCNTPTLYFCSTSKLSQNSHTILYSSYRFLSISELSPNLSHAQKSPLILVVA